MDTSIAETKMSEAIDNYLSLSSALTEDLLELQETESDTASWRRNYIRVVAATIEGYSHCFRQMLASGLELYPSRFSKKEINAISSSVGLSTSDRIKLTLRVTYREFEIPNPPDFGGIEWQDAALVFEKRHDLMHPKSPNDLDVGDSVWGSLWSGSTWLARQHFTFVEKLYEIHVRQNR